MKKALITGITGQDGTYLAGLLLSKGYQVHGIVRRASGFNTERIEHIYGEPQSDTRLHLHYGDLASAARLRQILELVQPDEIYNLGAQSHVRVSFDQPEYTADIVASGTLRLLEAFRDYAKASGCSPRFYQAGSSEMFGSSRPPQDESTPFYPRSPYAVSKVAAHWYAINFREAYGLFISNGILFNHESPRRGETFVTRKITRALGRIRFGFQQKLYLGNLEPRRDWPRA
jgi:GDPmannose 4,6-dehydratase